MGTDSSPPVTMPGSRRTTVPHRPTCVNSAGRLSWLARWNAASAGEMPVPGRAEPGGVGSRAGCTDATVSRRGVGGGSMPSV